MNFGLYKKNLMILSKLNYAAEQTPPSLLLNSYEKKIKIKKEFDWPSQSQDINPIQICILNRLFMLKNYPEWLHLYNSAKESHLKF